MKLFKKYTKEIHKQLGYYPAWKPGVEIALGDVGYLKGKVFIVKSNLKNLGIDFSVKEDTTPVSFSYASKGEVEVAVKASGTMPLAGSTLTDVEAGFNVKMEKEGSVFLKANNVYNHTIEDQISLGNEILRRVKSKVKKEQWDKDWVVVTEIAKADSCTILISKSKNNTVDITAKGELKAIDLDIAKADLGLALKSSKSLETIILGEKGLVPMFRLSKVRTKLLKKTFESYKAKSAIDYYGDNEMFIKDVEEYSVFEDVDVELYEESEVLYE